MYSHEGTYESTEDQDLRKVSELVGLALQAGRKTSAGKS